MATPISVKQRNPTQRIPKGCRCIPRKSRLLPSRLGECASRGETVCLSFALSCSPIEETVYETRNWPLMTSTLSAVDLLYHNTQKS